MANAQHLARLQQGVDTWNRWRAANPHIRPNLSTTSLKGVERVRADLAEADLIGANLRGANLFKANLSGANLVGAYLQGAMLSQANLRGVTLNRACFEGVILLETNFERANLTECSIDGISAWNVNLTGAQQLDLIITPEHEPKITVDNVEVAQFIYLMLHNEKIRHVIETVPSKAVLNLGGFTPARKAVLDAIRDELRRYDYLPMMADFQKPGGALPVERRNYIETVSTLAIWRASSSPICPVPM